MIRCTSACWVTMEAYPMTCFIITLLHSCAPLRQVRPAGVKHGAALKTWSLWRCPNRGQNCPWESSPAAIACSLFAFLSTDRTLRWRCTPATQHASDGKATKVIASRGHKKIISTLYLWLHKRMEMKWRFSIIATFLWGHGILKRVLKADAFNV